MASLKRLARRLIRNEKGLAAVEFALLIPFLLALYLGAVDLSQGLSADRKLTSVAGTLGDLVAQETSGTLPLSRLEDYFSASEAIMRPFRGSETEMMVALVHVDAFGETAVAWSQARNGAPSLPTGASFALPADLAAAARDSYVVVAQAWYRYQPVIGYVFNTPIRLQKQVFHIPRAGERIDLG